MFALKYTFTLRKDHVRRSIVLPLELLTGINLAEDGADAVRGVLDEHPDLLQELFGDFYHQYSSMIYGNGDYEKGAQHHSQELELVPVAA